jgi:sigma-B regulation protein RsbU (phosphoserine phosphatase)
VLLVALCRITGSPSGSKLNGWATFITLVFAFCVSWLTFHWVRLKLMWRLRHRLIVTYIFVGVIPILLLLLMAFMGSYLCAGQFATYVVISDLQSTLQNLDAANHALAAQLRTLESSGKLNEQTAGELAAVSGEDFPQRTITVWQGENGFLLSNNGEPLNLPPPKVPDGIKGDFIGFETDGDSLHLRVVKRYDGTGRTLTVISNVPLTPELFRPATSLLGSVTLLLPDRRGELEIPPPANNPSARPPVAAGRVPAASNRFDPAFRFFSLFKAVDWQTGKSQDVAIRVVTRPSMLFSTLFATLGDNTKVL